MNIRYIFFVFLLILGGTHAYGDNYPGVIFDNSLVKNIYAKSDVKYSGNSWIENISGHLVVEDSIFFTPGNSLSLKYTNAKDGFWEAEVRYHRQRFAYKVTNKEFLSLKVFVNSSNTGVKQLPALVLKQNGQHSDTVSVEKYVDAYNINTWMDIRIPMKEFGNVMLDSAVTALAFVQQGEGTHHIFVDQIEFIEEGYSKVALSSPAILSQARNYGQHVYLQWQMPLTPSLRYVKVYRSEDNKTFTPVAIRPAGSQGCLDFAPNVDKTYYYKVAWVDYDYRESPYSSVKEVSTSRIDGEQILDVTQLSNVNYFVENYDINSGMQIPFRTRQRAIVSTKETGLALLSLLVGVERGFVNHNTFISRVKRVVKFLDDAPNKHGFFAPFYDGRTGNNVFLDENPLYSVEATTSILQSLLVIRQYLGKDADANKELIQQITGLWDRTDWNQIVVPGTRDVLLADIGVMGDIGKPKTIGGFNESISSYILAVASPNHSIPAQNVKLYIEYKADTALLHKMDEINSFDVNNVSSLAHEKIRELENEEWIETGSMDSSGYGITFKMPINPDQNLLDLYAPFTLLNPSDVMINSDTATNILKDYITYNKRRDNEKFGTAAGIHLWGYLTRRDSVSITRLNPAIAISAIAIDGQVGNDALQAYFQDYGHILFTEYGFRSWIDLKNDDISEEYQAVNQALVTLMIENKRSGLLWDLYQTIPEIKEAKEKIFISGN